jgi:hypothetical protein
VTETTGKGLERGPVLKITADGERELPPGHTPKPSRSPSQRSSSSKQEGTNLDTPDTPPRETQKQSGTSSSSDEATRPAGSRQPKSPGQGSVPVPKQRSSSGQALNRNHDESPTPQPENQITVVLAAPIGTSREGQWTTAVGPSASSRPNRARFSSFRDESGPVRQRSYSQGGGSTTHGGAGTRSSVYSQKSGQSQAYSNGRGQSDREDLDGEGEDVDDEEEDGDEILHNGHASSNGGGVQKSFRQSSNDENGTGTDGHAQGRGQGDDQDGDNEQTDEARAAAQKRWSLLRSRVLPTRSTTNQGQPSGAGIKTVSALASTSIASIPITTELMAGQLPVMIFKTWMDRDEDGNRAVPVLLGNMRFRVGDSVGLKEGGATGREMFKVECEYGDGVVKWVSAVLELRETEELVFSQA